ncbi:MAG: hypothetical protein WCV90_06905 [Candidatus Woesearchaeota archaeon]|jgi:hypothetical protein
MNDKVDLSGVERKLESISNNLHKPLEDMRNRSYHQEILETQNKHHQEILESQNKFSRDTLSQQSKLNQWTKYLAIATIALCIFTMVMAGFTMSMAHSSKQSVDLQANLYSPKLTVQITDNKFPWSHYADEYNHKIWQMYWNRSSYSMPIYVEINNNGIIPFQLYNIQFDSKCGKGITKGLLSFPENFSKVVGIGTTASFTGEIYFAFNTTVQEGLPCDVDFIVYGNNLVVNKKIILVEDKTYN